MDPAGRSVVVQPQKKKVPLITPAAIACLKALDDLVHEHRKEIVEVKTWQGKQKVPFGEVSYYHLPNFDHKKPLAPQLAKFPLIEVWQTWLEKRPASQKDKDGLELLRASVAADTFGQYNFGEIKAFMKTPEKRKIVVAVLGEVEMPKLRYFDKVEVIVDRLLDVDLPKSSIDYLLDTVENSYAHVTDEMNKAVIQKPKADKPRHRYWHEERANDWRNISLFNKWSATLNRLVALQKRI